MIIEHYQNGYKKTFQNELVELKLFCDDHSLLYRDVEVNLTNNYFEQNEIK